MPRFVQLFVILALVLAVAFWWNYRRFALRFERLNHSLIRIVSFVCQHRIGNQIWQQLIGSIQITGLSRRETKAQRIAQRIYSGMNLGT